MDNPYSAPQAQLADAPGTPPGRPVLVWIIFIYAIVVTVFGMVGLAGLIMLHGKHSAVLSEAQNAYFSSLGVLDFGLMSVTYLLFAAGAIALFRLRRVAFNVYVVWAVLSFVEKAHRYAKPSYQAMIGPGPHIWAYTSGALMLVLLAYSYKLRRGGVLR